MRNILHKSDARLGIGWLHIIRQDLFMHMSLDSSAGYINVKANGTSYHRSLAMSTTTAVQVAPACFTDPPTPPPGPSPTPDSVFSAAVGSIPGGLVIPGGLMLGLGWVLFLGFFVGL